MPISVHCPQCGKKLNAPDSAAGKRARCPQCKTILTLPSADVPMADEILDAEPMQPSGLGLSDPGDAPSDEYGLAPDPNEQVYAPPPIPVGGGGGGGAASDPGPARRPCPMCGEMIAVTAMQCRFCNEVFDPSLKKARAKHISGRATSTSSHAIWALVCGIAGFFCFGFILGAVAISQSKKAKEEIAFSNGTIGGSGLATTGMVLGIIDIIAWLLIIVGRVAGN